MSTTKLLTYPKKETLLIEYHKDGTYFHCLPKELVFKIILHLNSVYHVINFSNCMSIHTYDDGWALIFKEKFPANWEILNLLGIINRRSARLEWKSIYLHTLLHARHSPISALYGKHYINLYNYS